MNSPLRILVATLAATVASSPPIHNAIAQTSDTPPGWVMPRTEYGHPNLQGRWKNQTQTPMERPNELLD